MVLEYSLHVTVIFMNVSYLKMNYHSFLFSIYVHISKGAANQFPV